MTADAMIVEDHPTVRDWVAETCARLFPDLKVNAFANLSSARSFLEASTRERQHLSFALIDIGLPDGSGIDLIQELNLKHPNAMAIVTTIYSDDRHIFDAITAGAQGYLLKDDDLASFEANLRRIRKGEPLMSPAVARRVMGHFRSLGRPADVELTKRETQVLALLELGLRNQEIAKELTISDHTVRDHIKAIYSKLNISSRAEAAVEATRRRLFGWDG